MTVRLLDPPLHEFLPRGDAEIDQVAHALNLKTHKVRARLSDCMNQTRCWVIGVSFGLRV